MIQPATSPSKTSAVAPNDAPRFDAHTGHMQNWGEALLGAGFSHLHRVLCEPRAETYRRMVRLGLPTVPHISLPLSVFLDDAEGVVSKLGVRDLRALVEPSAVSDPLPTFRFTRPDLSTFKERVCDSVSPHLRGGYSILLKEFIPEAYQLTVMCSDDGRLFAECSAPLSDSLQLHGTPDIRVQREPYLGTFKYTVEDQALRKLLWGALKCVPRRDSGASADFVSGYYEMIIARRSPESGFVVYFDDHRMGEGFAP